MSARTIDVLAVMDSAAGASNDIFRLAGSQLQRDIAEARAAVADLVRAARLARDTLPPCPQRDELTAALARVGGAA